MSQSNGETNLACNDWVLLPSIAKHALPQAFQDQSLFWAFTWGLQPTLKLMMFKAVTPPNWINAILHLPALTATSCLTELQTVFQESWWIGKTVKSFYRPLGKASFPKKSEIVSLGFIPLVSPFRYLGSFRTLNWSAIQEKTLTPT